MAKEGKKKTEEEKAAEAASGVPKAKDMANAAGGAAAGEPKKSVAEEVKETAGGMPGGGVNTWSVTGERGESDQTQHTQSAGTSSSVQRKVLDNDTLNANVAGAEDVYKRTPTAVDMVMPWLKDDLDPEKAAAAKRDANFRKGLHEAVESLRVLSDIGASFAGGNAYKREAPDYKRYEDEKAKIDAARKAALDKLFQAQAADRDYKRQLMGVAYGNSFTNEQTGKTNQTSDGTTHTQTEKEGATVGHQNNVSHSYSHSSGNGNKEDENVVANIPFTMSWDSKGAVTIGHGNSTAKFASGQKRVDFMNELASVTKSEEGSYQPAGAKGGRNAWSFIYDGLANSRSFNGVNFYDEKGNPTNEGKQIMSTMLGSAKPGTSSAEGRTDEKFIWKGNDLTGLKEDLLMRYALKTKSGQAKLKTYIGAGWVQTATDEAEIANGKKGGASAGGNGTGSYNEF